MPEVSVAMLDVDHHIHLIPVKRVIMLSIEHSALKKGEIKNYEISCMIRLSAEGGSHQFEDIIPSFFCVLASRRPWRKRPCR